MKLLSLSLAELQRHLRMNSAQARSGFVGSSRPYVLIDLIFDDGCNLWLAFKRDCFPLTLATLARINSFESSSLMTRCLKFVSGHCQLVLQEMANLVLAYPKPRFIPSTLHSPMLTAREVFIANIVFIKWLLHHTQSISRALSCGQDL